MTNDKQQTPVEWFIEELEEKGKAYEENQVVRTINICIDVSDYMELKQQAKAMHKKEIEDACKSSITSCGMGHIFIELPEQYYNETYGGGEQ
jgi:hypothetical protein